MAMTDREQTSDQEDSDLCTALARRDPAAFSELVRQHGPALYRIALRFTGHRQDAEDVVQETLLKVVTKIDTVTDPAALPGWLRQVTVNASLMRLRSRNREPDTLDELPETAFTVDGRHPRAVLPWPGLPEDAALRGEARAVLSAAVAELSEGSRAVYALTDIEGLDYADVAEMLNISPGAVRMRLHRARLALRDVLATYFAERTATGGVAVPVPPTGASAEAERNQQMTMAQRWDRVPLPLRDPNRSDYGVLAMRLVKLALGVVFLVAGLKLIIPKAFGLGDNRTELVASFTNPDKGWMAPWLVERITDLGIGISVFLLVQGIVEVVMALVVIAGLMTPMVGMTLGMMLITFTIATPTGGPVRIARDLGIAAAAFGLARMGGGYWGLDRLILRRADRLPRWFLVGSGLRAAARGGNHDPALLLMRLGMAYALLASAIFTAGLFANKLNTTVPVPLVLLAGIALAAGLFPRYLMGAIAVWLLIVGTVDVVDKGPLLGLENAKREIALAVFAGCVRSARARPMEPAARAAAPLPRSGATVGRLR